MKETPGIEKFTLVNYPLRCLPPSGAVVCPWLFSDMSLLHVPSPYPFLHVILFLIVQSVSAPTSPSTPPRAFQRQGEPALHICAVTESMSASSSLLLVFGLWMGYRRCLLGDLIELLFLCIMWSSSAFFFIYLYLSILYLSIFLSFSLSLSIYIYISLSLYYSCSSIQNAKLLFGICRVPVSLRFLSIQLLFKITNHLPSTKIGIFFIHYFLSSL